MDSQDLPALFQKYLVGSMGADELKRFIDVLHQEKNQAQVEQLIEASLHEKDNDNMQDGPDVHELYLDFRQRLDASQQPVVHRVRFIRRWWAAASILLVLTAGGYLWLSRPDLQKPAQAKVATPVNITPGKNGAVLQLADGRSVVLDSAGNSIIATQSGVRVVLKDGKLLYEQAGGRSGANDNGANDNGASGNDTRTAGGEIVYNTLHVPKGRQFQLTLPDGTQVWLNSASSLRYPARFDGSARKVYITGEAYFEVATNKQMPFIVDINQRAQVEVLGTHFNINAYEDEQTLNTTLLEGSIRISTGNAGGPGRTNGIPQTAILHPGQQAQMEAGQQTKMGPGQQAQMGTRLQLMDHVDLEKIMAWKNGLFNFEDASLPEVMKQIARWYDLDISYEKDIRPIHFGGEMSKNISLNDLLTILEKSEVHFRLENGRRLIVTQ